jgi:hypothetical protein
MIPPFDVRAPLLDAYRRTTFFADIPAGRLGLRIGETYSELDSLLEMTGTETWAYVTAYNPGSVRLSEDENMMRHRQLEQKVATQGFVSYPGEDVGDDRCWPAESSLLVLGTGRDDAERLGREFGQVALVYGARGREAELLLCA